MHEMLVKLEENSERIFELKTGTLYPLLYSLEQKGFGGEKGRMEVLQQGSK